MSPFHFEHDGKMRQSQKNIIGSAKNIMEKANIPLYAQKLQLDSFEKLNKQIQDEQDNSKYVNQLTLTLNPKNMEPGEISIRALTAVMGGLQALTDSIANTLFNQPSEKGKIPQEILEQNELIFKEAKAGSFKAIIEMKHNAQSSNSDEQSQVLNEVFNLLYSTRNEESLSDTVIDLGPRTLRTFNDWAKSIYELDIPLNLIWNSNKSGKYTFQMSPNDARSINQVLSHFNKVSEEDVVVSGQLVGANTRTKTFELIANNHEKITGKIAKDALKNVASFTLGNDCLVTLLKVTTKSSSVAREKINWTLKSIAPS